MALKLTVYISDECGPIAGLQHAPQEGLQEMADRVLSAANEGHGFFIYRAGDVEVTQ